MTTTIVCKGCQKELTPSSPNGPEWCFKCLTVAANDWMAKPYTLK